MSNSSRVLANAATQGDSTTLLAGYVAADGLAPQVFASVDQLSSIRRRRGDQLEVDNALVPDFPGPEIFGDEIQPGKLVPRDMKIPLSSYGLVSAFADNKITSTVVGKRKGNGRDADLAIVNGHSSSRHIGSDRHPSSNATVGGAQ